MLCDLCRKFATAVLQLESGLPASGHRPDRVGGHEFPHGNFDTIKASAEAGCQFCRFFSLVCGWNANADPRDTLSANSLRESRIVFVPNLREERFEFGFASGDHDFVTYVEFYLPHFTEKIPQFCWRQGRSISTAHEKISTSALATTISKRLDSEGSISRVRAWLAQCENSHANCTRQKDVVLPTRVIDVGKFGDSHVSILETSGRSGRYLTLSYCWGDCDSYRTTTSNLSAGIGSIHVGALPKTLRDAIEYTRLLGFFYIWIDALCIIQDSKADWEREAAKMCTIYENATLSLSILDSNSSEDGFLKDKPLSERLEMDDVTIDLGLRRACCSAGSAMFSSALEKRAWALQERVLAPAVLHFAADTVYWECGAGVASQDSPRFDPNSDPRDIEGQGSIYHLRPILRSWSTDIEVSRQRWYKLVELYSLRRLSFESDRAAAIYGLAMKFQRCRPDHYVAGIWSADIHTGLLWSTYPPSEGSDRSAVIRPSWSWLTADAPVIFRWAWNDDYSDSHWRPLSPKAKIEIMNIEQGMVLASDQAPYLSIHGLYEKGLLKSECGGIDITFVPGSGDKSWNDVDCDFDALQGLPVQVNAVTRQAHLVESLQVYCLLVAGDQGRDPSPLKYHYMIMEKVERGDVNWQGWISETDGRVEEDVPCFRRVGYAERWITCREDQVFFDSETEVDLELPAGHGEESDGEASPSEASQIEGSQGEAHKQPVLRKLILV